MKNFFLLFLLLHSYTVKAQIALDTLQADSYAAKAEQYYYQSVYDSMAVYYQKASKIYRQTARSEKEIHCLLELGRSYIANNQLVEAKVIVKKALSKSLRHLASPQAKEARAYRYLADIYRKEKRMDKSLRYYEKSLVIRKKLFGEGHPDMAHSLEGLGYYYWSSNDIGKAIEYFQKALAIKRKTLPEEHPEIALTLYNIANGYSMSRRIDQVIPIAQQALAIHQASIGERNGNGMDLYALMSYTFSQLKENEKGIRFAQQAIDIGLEFYGSNHIKLARSYYSLGACYQGSGNNSEALEAFSRGVEIMELLYEKGHPELSNYYNALGGLYLAMKAYDLAIENCLKAFKMTRLIDGNKMDWFYYNNLGDIYLKKGDDKQALKYLHRCEHTIKGNPVLSRYLIINYLNLGKVYHQSGRLEEALHYDQLSLATNTIGTFDPKKVYNNPPLNSYQDLYAFSQALKAKAEVLLDRFELKNKILDLRHSYETFIQLDSLIDIVRQTHIEENDRIRFNAVAQQTYGSAIRSCMLAYQTYGEDTYLEKAFYYAEKSKANALLQAINANKAIQFAGVPDSLIAQEKKLKADIAILQKRLLIAQQRGNQPVAQQFQNNLFDLNNKLHDLIARLDTLYPSFFKLKYDYSIASVGHIQQHLLDEKSALIEYFSGNSTIYVFAITRHTFTVHSIAKPPSYYDQLNMLRNSLSDYQLLQDSFEIAGNLYGESAWSLYELLLKKVLSAAELDGINSLIIVPDGELGYIPFETLLREPVEKKPIIDYTRLSYLIRDYPLSYTYSATLSLENRRQKKRQETKGYGGFAPIYDAGITDKLKLRSGNSLTDLPNARISVKKIARLIHGRSFLAQKANKATFKDQAPHFDILHLALHGFYDDRDPLLSHFAFTPSSDSLEENLLYAAELYNMQLNADLAVLSACNTALGKINRGEGIMSLSRAFAYAGVPSIVASLWSVPDQATSNIMVNSFRELKKGAGKDEALRMAKLNYLKNIQENKPGELYGHPLFWAGFVAIGDRGSIDFPTADLVYLMVLGGVVFFACLFWLLRRSSRKKAFPVVEAKEYQTV